MEGVVGGTVPESCFLSLLDWIKWLMLEEQIAKEMNNPCVRRLTSPDTAMVSVQSAAPELSVL